MSQHDQARTQLQRRLDQLTRRVGKIERDLRHLPSLDSQDRATELENDEVLEQLDVDSLAEVRQVRQALERIENGTYGTCATCGAAIGTARLEAIPSATQCLSCATKVAESG